MSSLEHTMRDGTKILIANMGSGHLINTIKMIQRKAKEGITIRRGGMSIGDNEPWYDEDELQGQDALEYLSVQKYLEEAWSRGLQA